MSDKATPREADVLSAIRMLSRLGQTASSYAIAERLGVARQVARRHLLALERKGLVADQPILVRSGHWKLTGE